MSDPTAEMYRREADRLIAEARVVQDPESKAALFQMARQYLKLAEFHGGPEYGGGVPGDLSPA